MTGAGDNLSADNLQNREGPPFFERDWAAFPLTKKTQADGWFSEE